MNSIQMEIILALHNIICYSYLINKSVRKDSIWIG